MSEVKVGDTVWVRSEVFQVRNNYMDLFVGGVGNIITISVQEGGVAPDVPGLAALAAVVAEVGADALLSALDDAAHALWEPQADILRRLAAALEVK